MTKRNWILSALSAIVLLCAAGAWYIGDGKVHMTFTRDDLQQRIDTKLDQRAETEHKIVISKVNLDLTGDKIGLDIDGSAVLRVPVTHREVPVTMQGHARGDLRYDAEKGTFYFNSQELELKDVQISGEEVDDKVTKFIDKWTTSTKIQAKKEQIAELAKHATKEGARIAAKKYLDVRPVYTFPENMKGQAARMVLDSVVVKNEQVIVTLSLWKATGPVIGLIVLGVLACAGGIFVAFRTRKQEN